MVQTQVIGRIALKNTHHMQFYTLILSHLEIFVQFNGEEEKIINLLESIWKKETGIKIMSYKKGMKEL